MLDSLRIIMGETFEVYKLATLDGRLFIPFFICLVYLLLSTAQEDDRARRCLVYPSLVLLFFLFNPVFIHLLYKFIEVPERIVRMYWPLPMDVIFVYCLVRLFLSFEAKWKKAVLALSMVVLLFLNSGGSIAGQSFSRAENIYKLPRGTQQVCDTLFSLGGYQPTRVMMPTDLFFWTREYNPYIQVPYVRDMDEMTDEKGNVDLDMMAQVALEGECKLVVLNSSAPSVGALEDYGFAEKTRIEAQDFQYVIYQLQE